MRDWLYVGALVWALWGGLWCDTRAIFADPAISPVWGNSAGGGDVTVQGESPPAVEEQAAGIKTNYDSFVATGSTGCPVAVIGRQVVDLATLSATGGGLALSTHANTLRAVSPDGHFLAVAVDEDASGSLRDVAIHDLRTRKLVQTIAATDIDGSFDGLQFAGSDKLLIAVRPNGEHAGPVECWDIVTGKLTQRISRGDRWNIPLATTPDGRYVAVLKGERICVCDISTGQTAALMQAIDLPGKAHRPMAFTELYGMAFSPDGLELAALANDCLFIWDNHGRIQARIVIPGEDRRAVFLRDSGWPLVRWSPDGKACLVDQRVLVDVKSSSVVVRINVPNFDSPAAVFLDANRLLLIHRAMPRNPFETVKIPWDDIRPALARLGDPAEVALWGPWAKVKLTFHAAHMLNADDELDAMKRLKLSMAQRLGMLHIVLAESAPLEVGMVLTESLADGMPVTHVDRDPVTGFPKVTTEPAKMKAVDGDIAVTFKVIANGTTCFATAVGGRGEGGTSLAENHRKMLEYLWGNIQTTSLPLYISADGRTVLPMEVDCK